MEYPMLILLHVALGVLWAGGAITMGLFVVPAVLEGGPAGAVVMNGVMKRRFAQIMVASGVVVVLTGVRLYMLHFSAAWLTSAEGIVLSIGALLGIGAFVIGIFVQKPTAERMGALAAQIAAAGAPPSEAQATELAALRARLGRVGRVLAFHLIGATLAMASHRLVGVL